MTMVQQSHQQRPRTAREELATTVASMISFHCIICFDEFNTTTQPPMVLPCGHTYVCLPCTKRLKRCMECRQSLFLPQTPTNNNNDAVTPSPYNNRRAATNVGNRGGVGGRGSRYGPNLTPPAHQLQYQPPPPQVPLPIPKNLVLLSMIEAAEQQQKQQNTMKAITSSSTQTSSEPYQQANKNSDDNAKKTRIKENIDSNRKRGTEENSQDPMSSHQTNRNRSVPQEVNLSLRNRRKGEENTNPDEEMSTDFSELGDNSSSGGLDENDVGSGEDDSLTEEEKESERFDRVIKSIETVMAGSCGTYAVREKEGLVVLPKDPRKNRKRLLERQWEQQQILLRSQQRRRLRESKLNSSNNRTSTEGVLKESSSANCPSEMSDGSSFATNDAASFQQLHLISSNVSRCGSQSTSTTRGGGKGLASLRLRKRQLENIINKRRSPAPVEPSSFPEPTKLVSEKRDDGDQSVASASPEEDEGSRHTRTKQPSSPTGVVVPTVDSISTTSQSIRDRLILQSKNQLVRDRRGRSPVKGRSSSRLRNTSPAPRKHVSCLSPDSRASSPPQSEIALSPRSCADQPPFRIKYGQTIQAVSFEDGVVTLARNQGYILATHSQLVKVGPARDESCRLEGLLEIVSRDGSELESKLKNNTKICQALFKKIELTQQAPAEHPIVSQFPSTPDPAARSPEVQRGGSHEKEDCCYTRGLDTLDDSNSLMQSSSLDPTDTGTPPVPQTPPTQLLQPSLQTPVPPNRRYPTTSIKTARRGLGGGGSSDSSSQGSMVPDTPKTIDNSDLDQMRRRYQHTHGLDETHPHARNRATRRSSMLENDHMDMIFGCGTSLLSAECLTESADPVVRDLFLPSPRYHLSGGYYEDDDNDYENDSSTRGGKSSSNPSPAGRTNPQTPRTPPTPPPSTATSAPRRGSVGVTRTPMWSSAPPESVASSSTLTPVLQPISSFDSAVNFRTGFSGHSGLAAVSSKKNYAKSYSPSAAASTSPYHGNQQHQQHSFHQQYPATSSQRRRVRMMGEHRGLGLRLDVRQAMANWGISTSHPS